MGSKPFKDQFYSNIIVYDERKRYYYLWQRMNKPLLDDEVRNMQLSLVDQMRRSVQGLAGDVAVPIAPYARSQDPVNPDSTILRYFRVTQKGPSGTANDFTVIGGSGIDDPAVMFVKGFYVFLTGDIDYTDQNDSGTLVDPAFTETPIPDLSTPTSDRVDVVYVDFSFGEVSPTLGANASEYTDTNLRNPIVGTETGNRLRAIFDIRVWEDYPNKEADGSARTSSLSAPYFRQNIFTNSDFLGSIDLTDPEANPIYKQHFLVPIAVLNRQAGIASITQDQIIDLLDLYDKRVLSTDEVSYRIHHGGYGETAVYELSLAPEFVPRFPNAVIDESAFATGLNQGFNTEAFNTDSVTPRVVQNEGRFNMGALLIGGETGPVTYPISALTGAEQLHRGELLANELSTKSLAVGFDRGVTGAREYVDRVSVEMQGVTATAVGIRVQNSTGETGTLNALLRGQSLGDTGNYVSVDYLGRMGINTTEPGWSGPNMIWNDTDSSNIVFDVDDSGKVRANLFIDGKLFVLGYVYGPSWQVPPYVSPETPAIFGFTGLVNNYNGAIPTYHKGITGRAAFYIRPGMAVVGDTGIPGYTGTFGFYECFDGNGDRVFTIGSLGDDFDRVVKTLYGTGQRVLFYTSYSFKYLPDGYDEISTGDIVSIQGFDFEGTPIMDSMTVTATVGITGAYEVSQWIQGLFANTKVIVQLDPYDEDRPITTRYGNDGKLIISDLEDNSLLEITSFTVDRALLDPIEIPLVKSKWYGSGLYGGDLLNLKFAKLDLGEAADAWLFNGDVFFNGNGYLNRVTFSPNVIFRDDVFVYGNFIADTTTFNGAKINALTVNISLKVDGRAAIHDHLVVGYPLDQAFNAFCGDVINYNKLAVLVNGDVRANGFYALPEENVDPKEFGTLAVRTRYYKTKLSLEINGTYGSSSNPLGWHLIDNRPGVVIDGDSSLNTIVIDYSNGRGTFGNVLLNVKGDIVADNSILTKHLSVGTALTEANTDYSIYVEGDSVFKGTVTVDNLKFSGAQSASGSEITTPANVIVYQIGKEYIIPPVGDILRTKKLSHSNKTILNNAGKLGGVLLDVGDDPKVPPTTWTPNPDEARFAHDTLSYANAQYVGTSNQIITTTDINKKSDPKLWRRYTDCILLANLGTLRIQWVGYAVMAIGGDDFVISNSDSNRIPSNVIQSYEFESPYFTNRAGGSTINWMPGKRFGDENLIAHVQVDLVGTHPGQFCGSAGKIYVPDIYSTNSPVSIYVPMDSWERFCVNENILSGTTAGYSYLLYYKHEKAINNFTRITLARKTGDTNSPYGPAYETWYIGIMPRINNQKRISYANSNTDKLFIGEWDLDLIMYPEAIGRCSNMIGQMYVSYMQG